MKPKTWNLLWISVLILTICSFLFVFKENQLEPQLAGIPFVFWSGFLITVLIVIATLLASKIFPYHESKKS